MYPRFVASKDFPPQRLVSDSPWFRSLLGRGDCRNVEPTTLTDGTAAALRECTRSVGGWRVLILAASPLSAIVCNVIRMVPTIWFFGHIKSIAEPFHNIAGWIMLGIAFLLLMGIIRLLKWALIPVSPYMLAMD